jgi:hypothetical protein
MISVVVEPIEILAIKIGSFLLKEIVSYFQISFANYDSNTSLSLFLSLSLSLSLSFILA